MRGVVGISFLLIAAVCGAAGGAQKQQRIEYARADGHVWIMNADGSGQHRSPLVGYTWWSSDGRRVALRLRSRDRSSLYVANPNGRARRKVVSEEPGEDCFDPAWSSRGAMLVFSTGCDIDFKDLWVVRRDGTHRKRLVPHSFWPLQPKWSPNGREILFAGTKDRTHSNASYGLFVTNAAGRKPQRISPVAFDFKYYIDWAWSRDGSSAYLVADTNNANQEFELILVDRKSGATRQLSPPEMNVRAFDVSPNGRSIALQGAVGRRDWEIYVMNADGGGLHQLTDNRGFEDSEPHWSRDGSLILFKSDRDGNEEIYVMNADGSDQHNLSHARGDDSNPSWIP